MSTRGRRVGRPRKTVSRYGDPVKPDLEEVGGKANDRGVEPNAEPTPARRSQRGTDSDSNSLHPVLLVQPLSSAKPSPNVTYEENGTADSFSEAPSLLLATGNEESIHAASSHEQSLLVTNTGHDVSEKSMIESNDESDDPSDIAAAGKRWFKVPGMEAKLCKLWQESPCLYDVGDQDHRNPKTRRAAVRKIAATLNVPAIYVNTRMNSLRTSYQKMVVQDKVSESGPKPKTSRMKQIMRLCSFLKDHVKTTPTRSSPYPQAGVGRPAKRPQRASNQFIKTHLYGQFEKQWMTANTETPLQYEEDHYTTSYYPIEDTVSDGGPVGTTAFEEDCHIEGYTMSDDTSMDRESTPALANISVKRIKREDDSSSVIRITPAGRSSTGKQPADKSYNLDFTEDSGDTNVQEDDQIILDEWFRVQNAVNRSNDYTPTDQVQEDRPGVQIKIADTATGMSETLVKKDDDAETLWARFLLLQMKRMDQGLKDKFMLHVHQIAMEAISGTWP